MLGRIVEIADDSRHLSLFRGFLQVRSTKEEKDIIGRVPLDDIAAVVANAHGLSYTNNLLVKLAELGVPFVFCGANHNVAGMLLTIDGNYQQAKRFDAQIAASKPTQKRVWAEIVKSKLSQQAAVLEEVGVPSGPVAALVSQVRSGDPDNREAMAAQRYWPLLFGSHFRRDRHAGGINILLNYGYTILRAATARAVTAAGLHPTLGVHHRNEGNSMRLVDDLMEPFRPRIDYAVWKLCEDSEPVLTKEVKQVLVGTLYSDIRTSSGKTPICVCLQRLAVSLTQVYLGERTTLDFPLYKQAEKKMPSVI
jgi:CRISP-associated protein Cas1